MQAAEDADARGGPVALEPGRERVEPLGERRPARDRLRSRLRRPARDSAPDTPRSFRAVPRDAASSDKGAIASLPVNPSLIFSRPRAAEGARVAPRRRGPSRREERDELNLRAHRLRGRPCVCSRRRSQRSSCSVRRRARRRKPSRSSNHLDADALKRQHAASGVIHCGNAHGAGQLTLADNVDDHRRACLLQRTGRAARATTRIASSSSTVGRPARSPTAIDMASIVAGSREPLQRKRRARLGGGAADAAVARGDALCARGAGRRRRRSASSRAAIPTGAPAGRCRWRTASCATASRPARRARANSPFDCAAGRRRLGRRAAQHRGLAPARRVRRLPLDRARPAHGVLAAATTISR